MLANPTVEDEKLVYDVIGAFYHVYNSLGFGFREKVYSAALTRTLEKRGIAVRREAPIRIWFEDEVIVTDCADLLVAERLIVENKTGRRLDPDAQDQLHSYLRGARLQNGLLLHFGPKARFYRQFITKW